MRVRNINANATEVSTGSMVILFSYGVPVACGIPNKGWFRTAERYSVTTSKHINGWLHGIAAEERPQEFFDHLLDEKENACT